MMADDKNTIHTPKTFSLEIEKIAFKKRCTHLEAISIYCEQMGIEPVTTAKLLTKSLKEKIEAAKKRLEAKKELTAKEKFLAKRAAKKTGTARQRTLQNESKRLKDRVYGL